MAVAGFERGQDARGAASDSSACVRDTSILDPILASHVAVTGQARRGARPCAECHAPRIDARLGRRGGRRELLEEILSEAVRHEGVLVDARPSPCGRV